MTGRLRKGLTMQTPGDISTGRAVLGVVGLAIMAGVGAFMVLRFIDRLPASDQPRAWWWCGMVYVVTAIGVATPYVVRWVRGTMLPSPEQQAQNTAAARTSTQYIGAGILLANVATILAGPGVEVALSSAFTGLATAGMVLSVLLNFTSKGRAMRARQLEVNQDPTA